MFHLKADSTADHQHYDDILVYIGDGWLLSIDEDGSGGIGYGALPIHHAGFAAGTFDFAAIHRELRAITTPQRSPSNYYAVAFHLRDAVSTTAVYTGDAMMILGLFKRAHEAAQHEACFKEFEEIWRKHPPAALQVTPHGDTPRQQKSPAAFKAFLSNFREIDLPVEIKAGVPAWGHQARAIDTISVRDYLCAYQKVSPGELNWHTRQTNHYYGYKIAARDSFIAVTHVEVFPIADYVVINYLTTFSPEGEYIARAVVGEEADTGMMMTKFSYSQIDTNLNIVFTRKAYERNKATGKDKFIYQQKRRYAVSANGSIIKLTSANSLHENKK